MSRRSLSSFSREMISLDPVWPGGQGQRWFEGLLFHVQRLRPSRRSHGTPTTRRRVFDRLSENRYSAYPLAALQGPRSSRRSSRPGLNRAMIYSIGRGNLVSVDRSSSVIRSNKGNRILLNSKLSFFFPFLFLFLRITSELKKLHASQWNDPEA